MVGNARTILGLAVFGHGAPAPSSGDGARELWSWSSRGRRAKRAEQGLTLGFIVQASSVGVRRCVIQGDREWLQFEAGLRAKPPNTGQIVVFKIPQWKQIPEIESKGFFSVAWQ